MADEDVIFEVHECLPCAICGHTVHYEFSVPNSVWNAVMRQDGHETDAEYICLSCFFTVLTTAITALQAENERLTKQLAEAEADADRLAKELHDWLVFAEANDQIYAARSGMNAMLHHQKRKEGK